MAPIIFKRNNVERRPRCIITRGILSRPQEDDELSPLEMERKMLVCDNQGENDNINATTPDTLDSMVMAFSDDSFDEFPEAEDKWWEQPTPAKKSSRSASLESSKRRPALCRLDKNSKIQLNTMKPINKINVECMGTWDWKAEKEHSKALSFPQKGKSEKTREANISQEEIQNEFEILWRRNNSPHLKTKIPPEYTIPTNETMPSKQPPNSKTPLMTGGDRRSPKLSPLDRRVFLTPAKKVSPSPKNLFDVRVDEEEQEVVEIKGKERKKESDDNSVISDLTKMEEDDEAENIDADCLLSNFLNNFMVSSPTTKKASTPTKEEAFTRELNTSDSCTPYFNVFETPDEIEL